MAGARVPEPSPRASRPAGLSGELEWGARAGSRTQVLLAQCSLPLRGCLLKPGPWDHLWSPESPSLQLSSHLSWRQGRVVPEPHRTRCPELDSILRQGATGARPEEEAGSRCLRPAPRVWPFSSEFDTLSFEHSPSERVRPSHQGRARCTQSHQKGSCVNALCKVHFKKRSL